MDDMDDMDELRERVWQSIRANEFHLRQFKQMGLTIETAYVAFVMGWDARGNMEAKLSQLSTEALDHVESANDSEINND